MSNFDTPVPQASNSTFLQLLLYVAGVYERVDMPRGRNGQNMRDSALEGAEKKLEGASPGAVEILMAEPFRPATEGKTSFACGHP